MNKLLVAAVMLAVSGITFAGISKVQFKQNVSLSSVQMPTVKNYINPQKIRRLTAAEAAEFSRVKSNAAGADEAIDLTSSDWKALTGARIKDPILTVLGATMPEIYSADVYQDVNDELHYAVSTPLLHSAYTGFELLSSSAVYLSQTGVMELIAKNDEDDRYYFPTVELGTINSSYQAAFGGGKKLSLMSVAGYNIAEKGKDSNGSHYGYLDNNVITFPAGSVYLCVDGEPFGSYTEDYAIALPDGKLYESSMVAYAVNITGEGEDMTVSLGDPCTCVAESDDYLVIFYDLGGDLTSAELAMIPVYCTPDEAYYKLANQDFNLGTVTSEDNGYFFDQPSYVCEQIMEAYGSEVQSRLPYSYVIAGFDDEGNYLPGSGSVIQLFYRPDESSLYKSVGKGTFTDDVFASLLGLDELPTAEVEIEEAVEEESKGYIRVKNPYNTMYGEDVDTTHDHYLYMNVREQEGYPICIEPSSTGVDLGGGNVMVVSASYYGMFYDDIESSYYAQYDEATNTITFPQYSVYLAQPYLYKGDWQPTNATGKMTLKLPDGYTAVKDIVSDRVDNSAEVEYFNLQGMKISNPAPGQMVIRRQGTTTTKQVIR